MIEIQQPDLSHVVPQGSYGLRDIAAVEAVLKNLKTLELTSINNGLFSAVIGAGADAESGYQHVWIRDNVHIANSLLERGEYSAAKQIVQSIGRFLGNHRHRFENIIEGRVSREDPGQRPHVRFDGERLEELPERWAHAQNDALGYILWMRFRMVNSGSWTISSEELDLYSLFPRFFATIEYWRDPDSGHWEEQRELLNSSVGTVVAGLQEMRLYLECSASHAETSVTVKELDGLIAAGKRQLKTLPLESATRSVDAALLFLLYPLDVAAQMDDQILERVRTTLVGQHGIKRYVGDSYWAPGYKSKLSAHDRTRDWSEDVVVRDAHMPRSMWGTAEAEWCIFDPIVSIIYGRRFLQHRRRADLELQITHFNRALAQVTADGQCPEAYYIEDERVGTYVPNDHVPLAWAQANLAAALEFLKRSVQAASG